MTTRVGTEHVLVADADAFQNLAGIIEPASRMRLNDVMDNLFAPKWLSILPRDLAETNLMARQIIPYVVIMRENCLLSYRRGLKGRETRLHGLRSIGWGGHVDLSDVKLRGEEIDVLSTIRTCAEREVAEELGFRGPSDRDYIGLIVERDGDVGRVHVGFVEVWTVNDTSTATLEEKSEDVSWLTLAQVRAESQKLESWSAHALELLDARATSNCIG